MKSFPIMGGPAIPWGLIEPHERQAQRNHSQSLARLAERGGLSPCEALAVLEDRDWRHMSEEDARREFKALVDTDLRAQIATLTERAAVAEDALARLTWQDISTAPKDGREILVHDDGATMIAWFNEDANAWMDNGLMSPPPQLWMPMPTDPPAPDRSLHGLKG